MVFNIAIFALSVAAFVLSGFKLLRIAQREHYIPGYVSRFYIRWLKLPENFMFFLLSVLLTAGSFFYRPLVIAALVLIAFMPLGMSFFGESSLLKFTRRATFTFAVSLVVFFIVALLLYKLKAQSDYFANMVAPGIFDFSLFILNPVEKKLSYKYVKLAQEKLKKVNPTVIAITGSYGKTTIKNMLALILSSRYEVYASPASYNNELGLARAINEGLTLSTKFFIAEMGTYKIGEIAQMCSWIKPEFSAISQIAPVHLERFKKLENTVKAKAEIAQSAKAVVLNVDNPYLMPLCQVFEDQGKKVIKVSENKYVEADVKACVVSVSGATQILEITAFQNEPAFLRVDSSVSAINLAIAIGLASLCELSIQEIISACSKLSSVEHRLNTYTSNSGYLIIDDTYNSNPSGAKKALRFGLDLLAPNGTLVVVTPGMVELGPIQFEENKKLAEFIKHNNADLVIVGHVNKKALKAGYPDAKWVPKRKDAIKLLKDYPEISKLVVLFENDLPDHYP
jgi:UDP-N-acetylmuramoyl-tripeptide--D-alanyl-D-alanine ligase